jgi:hypothetical protein
MSLRRPLVRKLGLMVLCVALLALAVGGVSALASSDAPAGWEVGAASEKMDMSVSDSALAAGKTLSDFPVKVLLSQGNFDYTGGAQAEHLVFTTAGSSTPLPYEVEEWEPAGTSVVWVRIPQLTSTPQELDLYFGTGTPANTTDPTEVWDAGFVAVNHFDAASGTSEPDSTSNGFDGTIGAGTETLAEPGQDGGFSLGLSGLAESDVDFGTTMGDALEHFSFSTTVDVPAEDVTGTAYHLIGGRDQNSGAHPGEQFSLLIHEGHAYASALNPLTTTAISGSTSASNSAVSAGWHSFTVTYDGSNLKLYIDGTLATTTAMTSGIASGSSLLHFLLGTYTPNAEKTTWTNFGYDEMRVSDSDRGAEWIEAEDLAQTDQLVTEQPFESQGGGSTPPPSGNPWAVSSALQRLELSVGDAQLQRTLSNFPVLVEVDPSDFDYADAEPDHLAFVAAGESTPLPYEIERWNPDGTSSFWVKMPTLSSTSTTLDLYYDGSPLNTTASTEVWEPKFLEVNHFSVDEGVIADSTQNGFDGTPVSGGGLYEQETGSNTFGYLLNGQNGNVDFGSEMGDSLSNYSFTATVDVTPAILAASSYHQIGGRDQYSGAHPGEQFSMLIHQGHAYASILKESGEGLAAVSTPTTAASTEVTAGWHTFTSTFDGSELDLYIDGKLAAQVTAEVTLAHGEALLPFLLGAYTSGESPTAFDYDEFRLSNVAREPEWIEAEALAQTDQLAAAAPSSEAQDGQVVASVASPAQGATVAATVPLTGNVSEPSTVGYKLDGGSEVSLGDVQSSFSTQLTGLTDGSHTLVLTAHPDGGEGGSITRTIHFSVDTEAPTISFQTPAAGQVFGVQESFTLNASASDPGGVAAETITLDGKEVQDGETFAPGSLPIGRHTLVLEATDSFGNSAEEEITFFTGEGASFANPQPADGAQGIDPTKATIAVTPSDGIGGNLKVRFRRGYVADAGDGGIVAVKEGSSTTEAPGDSGGTAVADTVGIGAAGDGKSLVSESGEAFPYQRFDISVPASLESDSFDAKWSGTVPQGERAALSVWNKTKDGWEVVDAATGTGSELTLEGPARIAETVSAGTAQVLVQDIPAHVFGDGDATLNTAWLTDTQFYSESNPATLKAETEWVMSHNAEAEAQHEPDNAISYGFLTGDIVNSAGSQSQWENASPAFRVWDEAKFPYGLVEGNHDQLNCPYTSQNGCGESNASNPQIPGFSTYQSYFGEDRYDENSWYGEGEFDNVQHYDLVSTPKANYLYLFLDFYLTPQETTWAKAVIADHPGYNVIIATHEYQYQNGSYVTEQPLAGVGIGQRIYNELVKPYPNVLAVFSGHIWPSEHWQTKEPTPGRIVDEVLYDPQSQPNQGNGWMAEVSLDAAAQTMTKKQFSVTIPTLGNSYEIEGHDEEAQANFTIPMDIQPPARVLSTDYVSATALGGAVIGEEEVASGSEAKASVPASLLAAGEDFAWYAEAKDSAGVTTESPLYKFAPTGEFGTTAVTVAGVAAVGQTLTADTSAWQPPADSYAYQWEEDGQAIPGETAATLKLTPAMEGHRISVTATGTKQNLGEATATSPAVTVVKGDFTPGRVTIGGEAKVGGRLSISLDGWDPTPSTVAYQWLRDGQPIAGATGAEYEATAADASHALAVQVTVGGEGFNGLTATSASVTVTGGTLTDVAPPLIEGHVKLGHEVTVNFGETAPAKDAGPHVQWLLEGKPIPNAVQPTYAIQAEDVYKRLSVAVTYAPQGYEPLTVQSREDVVAMGDFEPGEPAVSGAALVGATVSAEAGEWAPTPAGYSYQWYLDGRPVAGATGSSYRIADTDSGHELSVGVTAKASGYTDFTARSGGVAVQAGELAATRKPTVAGKVAEGSTVHAVTGAWSAPVKVAGYQWLLDEKPIAGATGSEYRIAAGEAGKWLSVRVSVEADGYGRAEATSAGLIVARGPKGIASKPKHPTKKASAKKGRRRKKKRHAAHGRTKELAHSGAVSILGGGRPGDTVKLGLGHWSPRPSFDYRWLLGGKPVPGATARRFEIPTGAGGERLAARVIAKAPGYRPTTAQPRPLVVRP